MTKKEKKDKFKRAEVTEANVEVGYVNEQDVHIADECKALDVNSPRSYVPYFKLYTNGKKYALTLQDVKFDAEYDEKSKYLEMFSIDKMRERFEGGEKISDICFDLKNFIIENKDTNPDLVQIAISHLLDNAEHYYDKGTDNWLHISGFTRKHQGNSSEEMLLKLMNTKNSECLSGFVCSTISEFGMHVLEECGINAVMLCGDGGDSNHTTLLWQRSDGKFVQNDYGFSHLLNATNIKDAAREVYKNNLGLSTNGYIYFVDEHGSYQEFSMKEEAVWGRELDKRDYNNQSVFNHNVNSKSSINGNVHFSNRGAVEAEVSGSLAYQNEDKTKSKETTFALGYKKSGVTSLADSSVSIGGKVEHKSETITDDGKKFSDLKVVVDLTKLHAKNSIAGELTEITSANTKLSDPNQEKELRKFYGDIYEEAVPRDEFKQGYDWCTNYIQEYNAMENHQTPPITLEDFIQQRHDDKYNQLDTRSKLVFDSQIKKEWENYLIDNKYVGALAVVQQRQNYYKDILDNYDSEKNKFVNNNMVFDSASSSNFRILTTPDRHSTLITAFIRKVFGRENTLVKDDNFELANAWQASGLLGFSLVPTSTFSFGGDMRLGFEDGLKLNIAKGGTISSTAVSGGFVADMSLKSGTLSAAVSPGMKLNGSSIFQSHVSDNVTLGAGIDGFAVVTAQSTDWGVGGHAQAAYKPNGLNVTIFGSADANLNKQQLRIGSFNALSEYISGLSASLGVTLKSGMVVKCSFSKSNDYLNPTRNRTMFSVGAKINL